MKAAHISIVLLLILYAGTGCHEGVSDDFQSIDNEILTSEMLTNQTEMADEIGEDDDMKNNCRLIVNGRDISSESYVFLKHDERYAELPLTAIVKALGASVEWKSETVAIILHNEKEYVLDTDQYSLVQKGGNALENFLAPPPGLTIGQNGKIIKGEFVISSNVIQKFIKRLGAKINLDYIQSIIYIDTVD